MDVPQVTTIDDGRNYGLIIDGGTPGAGGSLVRPRRGRAVQWADAAPVLRNGEIAIRDNDLVIGDGTTSAASITPVGGSTYVRTLGVSSGTDDTATINECLAAAATTTGRSYVRGLPGEAYKISATLEIGSGTTLDMIGCRIMCLPPFSAGPVVTNINRWLSRSVLDGVTTATSTTLTSATATFVSGDVGKTCWVWGAGLHGSILRTTIASTTAFTVSSTGTPGGNMTFSYLVAD